MAFKRSGVRFSYAPQKRGQQIAVLFLCSKLFSPPRFALVARLGKNHYLRIDEYNKRQMATEEDFFAGKPVAWGLYEALKKELVWRYPEMEVRVAKTQVSFFDRLMFGCVSFTRVRRKAEMPTQFLTLTLGLPEPVDSPRIAVKCEPYPGRWTHHIVLASADEIDAELLAWIDRAHQFAQR